MVVRRAGLSLRHLRVFREVVRCQSITAASTRVHLSQPAITQAIAKLEKTLQVALFVRSASGMHVTEPGTAFLNRVERALGYIKTGAGRVSKAGCKGKPDQFHRFDQLLTSVQLRALLAVSEAGNFSLAARNVAISQPTLHRTARDLERLSGVELFKKVAQGIELTPLAKELVQYARMAFVELEQGIDEIDAWRGLDTGRIVVGTMPLARTFILPKAINEFSELHPHARVSVIDGPYDGLLNGLRNGEIDILIGALRDPVPIEDVIQEELFCDSLVIMARSDHALASKRKISVKDLASYPWVVPRAGAPTRASFEKLFKSRPLMAPTQIVESSSLILIRGLLLESDRLTLISAHQVRHEEGLGLLVRLPFKLNPTGRPIGITTRSNWQPTEMQCSLLDSLRRASQNLS